MKRRDIGFLSASLGALALAATFSYLGAVMADTHQPVAIEPDAKYADGVQVATFALG